MRVAIVFDNFGPYHVARLAAAADLMDVLGVEVAATSTEYDWVSPEAPQGLKRVRLLEDSSRRSDWSLLSAGYDERVSPWRPDAIALPGWSSPAALAGARWAARCDVPAIVMSESNADDFPRNAVLEYVKRRLLILFKAALCGGTRARSYLEYLGLPRDRIFVGYDVVDNAYFAKASVSARESGLMPEGIDRVWRGRYFLAIARFVPKKNLPRLIDAFALYRQTAGPVAWPLVLLGDGSMRGELENRRADLGLEASLVMPGFKQYDELPHYYGSAGAFVFASTTEQWGLVVNEAMASGLPVLVSERCGCAPDLVENGHNGYTFDPYDADALAKLMLRVASDDCDRAAMGRASREIIARWSPQTFAEGMRQAAEVALCLGPAKPGLFDKALLWTLLQCR